ncbi:hypothetical protein NHP190003_08460 [Helicobacter sp. NHP19-003]|uniref:Diaminopimelate decarboxylase n=1 Tax=Helicobacter gastrocanis TaxID=2849641 RepID=A0ABM7SBZ4_9HELI|nr:diaminopimelate decarboxylase [Helicobacter sp. NHP19-003]BCZ17564.1 hypothetical protein NHP190003_08460 [Helicobacter sp. NHP19-003]
MLDPTQITALADKTPFYLYDLEGVQNAFLEFKEVFKGRKSLICYALKANSNLALLEVLAKAGAGADCVSIYEVHRALLAGIAPYKIIFSGVGKLESEIVEALEKGILFLNVESFEELRLIERIAKEKHTKARISVRVNPNIDPATHPYISTGLWENKFGVEEKEAMQMFMFAKQSAFLEPIALHFHIGSQLLQLAPLEQAFEKMAALARFLLASGVELKFFDIGGGLGVAYNETQEPIPLQSYATSLFQATKGLDLTIICEPGRRIVADHGVLITKVQYTKSNARKHFAIVDLGMNDFMRPALYQATHPVRPLIPTTARKVVYDLVGPICESADCFVKGVELPELKRGDLLVFEKVGAYGASMASHYNSRPNLLELGLEGGMIRTLKEREDFFDLVRHEMGHLKREGIVSKRAQIDQIDASLIKLLNERFSLSAQIAKDKHQTGVSVYNPIREAEIFAKVGRRLESVYTEILSVSRGLVFPEQVGVSARTNIARRILGQQVKLQLYTPKRLFSALLLKGVDYGLLEIKRTCAYAEGLKALAVYVGRQDLEIAHSFKVGGAWCLLIGRFGFLAQTNPTRKALWFEPTQTQEVQALLKTYANPYFSATKFGGLLEIDLDLDLPPHLNPLILGTYSNTRRACGV